MPESPLSPLRLGQGGDLVESHLLDLRDDHLGDAVAMVYRKRLPAVIDEDHLHLAAIVSIDGRRRIGKGDHVAESQAAAWPELGLETFGKLDGESGRDEDGRKRLDRDRGVQAGRDVHPGGMAGRIDGKGGFLIQANYLYLKHRSMDLWGVDGTGRENAPKIQKNADLDPASDTVYALAFGAHPDDVELSCGATLLKIIAEGRRVAVCDLTRGEMGTQGTPESRRQEALDAMAIMGYASREILDMGDSELFYTKENLRDIVRIVRRHRPAVVFCNPPQERHPDHMKASKLVHDACFYAGLQKFETTLDGQAQLPHRPRHLLYYIQFRQLEPDIIVDVSETFDHSRKGILAFGSQFRRDEKSGAPVTLINRKEFLTGLEARAHALGEQIGARYGEGFVLSAPLGVNDFSGLFPGGA